MWVKKRVNYGLVQENKEAKLMLEPKIVQIKLSQSVYEIFSLVVTFHISFLITPSCVFFAFMNNLIG